MKISTLSDIRTIKRLRELCLHLADWASYEQSGCADPEILKELAELRKESSRDTK